jgi:small subunit ribosomal protein S15
MSNRKATNLPNKQDTISKFGENETDTGSTRVQIALLSDRIDHLTEHLKLHRKDHHSRRGLLMLVGKRRRFLDYLHDNDIEEYRSLIAELGLRR